MRTTILLLIFVPFLFCCKNKDVESESAIKKIVLDLNTSQHIGFSEFAESIDFTLFEQTDESNISLVKRIISHKDRYYLLNTQGYTHCTILVFDKQGNFIYKLDKRGGGPDEYVELEDFAIDKKNDELVLLTYPKGIYVYDLEGNFIRKDLGKHGRDVAVDTKGNIYQTMSCSEESPFRLLYISPNDTCFYAPVEKKDYQRTNNFAFQNEFETFRDKVYYSFPHGDTIYNVTNGQNIPHLFIDYNGKNFPVEKVFKANKTLEQTIKDSEEYPQSIRTNAYRFTDNFLYVGAVDGERHGFIALYSFKTGKTLTANRLVDDVYFPNNTFVVKPFRMPIAAEDNSLFLFVRPSWLLKGYETYKANIRPEKWERFCKSHPKLIEICSKIDEESNPILLKIKVKEF